MDDAEEHRQRPQDAVSVDGDGGEDADGEDRGEVGGRREGGELEAGAHRRLGRVG
jgi:hypothetical protein